MSKMITKKKKKKPAKKTLQQIQQQAHRKDIRSIFRNVGFTKVLAVSDKEFEFKGHKSDFDDVFVYHNILVFAEYTVSASGNSVSAHLKSKKIIYDFILKNKTEFLECFEEKFPSFSEARDDFYDLDQCEIVVLYCSRNSINENLKSKISNIHYLDYPILKYFKSVSDAIKMSARFELFSFLKLEYENIGPGKISFLSASNKFEGSVLPESHSNFDKGFKVVSFYVDPSTLLSKSYVLRNDGWNDQEDLYQRMISSAKIISIRKYLNEHQRVFINNIIVTLPDSTKIVDEEDVPIDMKAIVKTRPATITIPSGFNVVGIIDGQHRVFSYHEGGIHEESISKLRIKQNLLATGIIYPKTISKSDKTKFEAKLFLEINSNQTGAKTDLKQAIALLLKPYSAEAIAKAVLNGLNNSGALEDVFERHFYDQNKLKTSSIVSFALKPIVKLSGNDSFYFRWTNSEKQQLLEESDEELLEKYIKYCVSEINKFISAVRVEVGNDRWVADKSVQNRVLTVTILNGLIICLRKLILNKRISSFDSYKDSLQGFKKYKFQDYKSSQYSRMAENIYAKYFDK